MPIKESPSTLVTCPPDGVDNKDESSAFMPFQVYSYVPGRGCSCRGVNVVDADLTPGLT